ncbi:MAG TPA: hypothetical protein VL986_00415 [Terracidiphilus sp.]|nr:hypothetical protein [Terracidiphilus sp.]
MSRLRGPATFVPAVLLIAIALCSCKNRQTSGDSPQTDTPASPTAEAAAVRGWIQSVAVDVTQTGPEAWLKYFDDSPSFFMANNGSMAFPNGAAAQDGTKKFAATISHIEVKWGDDIRVNVLTPELASVGAPWHEVQIDLKGHRVEEAGYFTATAEKRGGRWIFRDVHWSMPLPPAR